MKPHAKRVDALTEEAEALAQEHIEVQRLLDEAKENEGKARQSAERLQDRLEQATGPKTALESEPRLTELLDGERVDLDQDAHLLVERLAGAIAEAEREHVALRIEDARDDHARLALADGRLLPPPAVVTEACRILRDRQIDAWPGWERLADYPQRKREEFTARAPHLVSGVLLNSGGDVSEARDILAALTPQPTAYVAVGTSEALESLQAGQPNGVAFTLPFHPALYDHAAAETEHRAVEERCSQRIQRLAEVVASKRRDEALRHRIATWRESYPPGPLQPCPKQLLWPPDSTTSPNDWPRSRDGRTWPVPPKYDEISRTKRLTKPCDADMDGLKGLIHSAFRLNVQGNSPSGNSLGGLCRPPLGALFWV